MTPGQRRTLARIINARVVAHAVLLVVVVIVAGCFLPPLLLLALVIPRLLRRQRRLLRQRQGLGLLLHTLVKMGDPRLRHV